MADPYRDHLRARRAEDPAVPVQRLLCEIRELGYTGSMNLLYRYITQGRVEAGRPHLSPRRVTLCRSKIGFSALACVFWTLRRLACTR